jgi:hypothetical protein
MLELILQINILSSIQKEIDRGFSVTTLPSGSIQLHALVVLCLSQKRRFSPHYHQLIWMCCRDHLYHIVHHLCAKGRKGINIIYYL